MLFRSALVTDTGGTKREIMRAAEALLPSPLAFVGGHPLAGPLTAGVDHPAATVFQSTVYCLTPGRTTAEWAVGEAVELVERLGATPRFMDADEHDGLLAGISHLPYFSAVALLNAVATQSGWAEMSHMAAGGFRAATAPADSEPGMWTDVAATNRENVVRQLDEYIEELSRLRKMISSGDEALSSELSRAHAARQAWLANRT